MTAGDLTEWLRSEAHAAGFDLVGFCSAEAPLSSGFLNDWLAAGMHGSMEFMARQSSLRASLESVMLGVRSVMVVGLNYCQPTETRPDYPKIARYALGRDYHRVIRGRLAKIGAELQRTSPGCRVRAAADSAPVFERELAQRAGLGWFGKNTCLINSARGSWFLLGVLLTDLELVADQPSTGGCGTCTACVDACPTGAIVRFGDRWAVDARTCLSALTIETKGDLVTNTTGWTFGCDICQEICPFNQPRPSQPLRAQDTQDPDIRKDRDWPPLDAIEDWTQEQWDIQTRGSATRRADVAMWRRNARLSRSQSG